MYSPSDHGRRVARLFDGIAGWYDFLNHFLSAGFDIYWRRRLVRFVRLGSTRTVLDLAAGTLDVGREILRRHPQVKVAAFDFSRSMLRAGAGKVPTAFPVQADARALPLPDACVDAVTIAFGIRNILPRTDVYKEILRVLTPGGRLCVLEFGTGRAKIWRGLYNFYLRAVLPRIGRFFSRDPSAYQYLADTIRAFPDAETLCSELLKSGFDQAGYQPLTSGIVYIHVARKPFQETL